VRRSASKCFKVLELCQHKGWIKNLLRKLCTIPPSRSQLVYGLHLPLQQLAIPFQNFTTLHHRQTSHKNRDQEKAPNKLEIEKRRNLHLHCSERRQGQSAPAYTTGIPRSTTPVSSGHRTSREAPSVHKEGCSQTQGGSDKSGELLPLRWTWTRKA
jgi:hypothetical protein